MQSLELGQFASRLLKNGIKVPIGNNVESPIYPTDYTNKFDSENERLIYGFTVRHFLASLDVDAMVKISFYYVTNVK